MASYFKTQPLLSDVISGNHYDGQFVTTSYQNCETTEVREMVWPSCTGDISSSQGMHDSHCGIAHLSVRLHTCQRDYIPTLQLPK